MNGNDWLTRPGLGWLLGAQFALISTHFTHLPYWVVVIWLFAAGWRVLVFQGRIGFPPRWLKLLLMVVVILALWQRHGDWRGLEPVVALLIAGFCFKLMEASSRRDANVLLFLGYFVALAAFLFGQELLVALHVAAAIVLLLTAQVALHLGEREGFDWQPVRRALVLAGQALPVTALLFLVVPRLPPLWAVPAVTDQARTGMSATMSPGDIAALARSDRLAFRARFPEGPLPPSQRYWRGLVLDRFDGRSWRPGSLGEWPRTAAPAARRDGGMPYEIFLEPTGERWLYALSRSVSSQQGVVETADFRLVAARPVTAKFRYEARALAMPDGRTGLHPWLRQRLLALPEGFNPRTREWGEQLRARFQDDATLIAAVLAHFRREPYAYTLRPPRLGYHSVDEFLFDTRRGFCEHYASSFVFALRAAGIPARVVVGYQGGEINPLSGMVTVRQYDAHAWAEVWLPRPGWVRFDPTAAVAPDRIETGLESAVGQAEFLADAPLSPNRYRHIGWLNQARLRMDAVNHQWTRWIVNFDDDAQQTALRQVLGEVTAPRLMLLVVLGGAVPLAVFGAWLRWQRRGPRRTVEQRLFDSFCQRMARRGYAREPAVAPRVYGAWLLQQQPTWRFAEEVARCYDALQYRPLNQRQRSLLLRELRRQIRKARQVT